MASVTWNPNINSSNPYVVLTVTQGTQSVTNNTTVVNYSLKLYRPYNINSTANKTYSVVINGSTVKSGTTKIGGSGTKTIASGSTTITHASDGKKTISFSFSMQISITWSGKATGNASGSGSMALTTIPRYAKITSFSLASQSCIRFGVYYSVDRAVDAVQYSLNGGTWTTIPTSHWIGGLTPNKYYTLRLRVKSTASQLWTYSSTLGITTYRLSTVSYSNFNFGNSVTPSISRSTTLITHTTYLQFKNSSGNWQNIQIKTGVGASVTFTPTESELNTVYSTMHSWKDITTRIVLYNYWDGVFQGSSVSADRIGSIVNANPTLDGVSYKDISTSIQEILGNNQKILRNKSILEVITGTATTQKGATLKLYKVAIGGVEKTISTSGTSETGKVISVGTINQSANQTAVLTVTDSRGYTATKSFTVQILDYQNPNFIQVSADRLNNYEEPSTFNAKARHTIVKPNDTDVNEFFVRFRLKENPNGNYGDWVNITSGDISNSTVNGVLKDSVISKYISDYPNDKSYTVEVSIKDNFTEVIDNVPQWITYLITLPEGIALLKFKKDKIVAGVDVDISKNLSVLGTENIFGTAHIPFGKTGISSQQEITSFDSEQAFTSGFYRAGIGKSGAPHSSGYFQMLTLGGVQLALRWSGSNNQEIWMRTGRDGYLASDRDIDDWKRVDTSETGSNANGNWIRYGNGTMIYYGFFVHTGPCSSTIGTNMFRTANGIATPAIPVDFVGDVIRKFFTVPYSSGTDAVIFGIKTQSKSSRVDILTPIAHASITVKVGFEYLGRWK